MASLFGDDLDRLTLWEKIGSALSAACDKVSDDDLDRFASLCLETIKASDSRVAACGAMSQMLATFETRPSEWKYAFISHIQTHRHAVLVHGRNRWEQVKTKAVEL